MSRFFSKTIVAHPIVAVAQVPAAQTVAKGPVRETVDVYIPMVDPEVASVFHAFRPGKVIDRVYYEAELVKIVVDNETGKTVAFYDFVVLDEDDEAWADIYSFLYEIVGNRVSPSIDYGKRTVEIDAYRRGRRRRRQE